MRDTANSSVKARTMNPETEKLMQQLEQQYEGTAMKPLYTATVLRNVNCLKELGYIAIRNHL
ncbi:hypothetical protein SAMD00079811_38640 [Scytonema sp. HK-05]|nr:hypothetical protein NIES2130_09270 [Scytonema sp. HK-05]BAY46256.1 hypothetical protein SAMD00079811_38640 [Scytonema sp. HK-05]